MPLASLTRRLLRPRMDGLIGRAPSSGITTAQLAEAAPAHLICRTRRSENRELDLYTPKSARKASSREPYPGFAIWTDFSLVSHCRVATERSIPHCWPPQRVTKV